MKRQEIFIWTDQDASGLGPGWLLSTMPHFDPVQGFGMAHDLIEHIDTNSSLEAEVCAFGIMGITRLEGGYLDEQASKFHRAPDREGFADTLAEELAVFMAGHDWTLERIVEPPLTGGDEEEIDDFFMQVARSLCRCGTAECDTDDDRPKVTKIRIAAINAIHWMRRGYREGYKFWDTNAQALSALLQDIESTIDTEIAHTEHQHGDRIEVVIADDLTWELKYLEGRDADGNLWENGEIVEPEDE